MLIIPSKENMEKIFRIYKNKCAFHGCNRKIIDSDNHVNGKMFFIRSNKKGHPRYDPKISDNEMSNYTNLIIFCDEHGWDVEKQPDVYTSSKLQAKLDDDLKNLPDGNFEFSDETYDEFLKAFLHYHDPDKFAHIQTYFFLYDDGAGGMLDSVTCRDNYIKPTKHMPRGKFELIFRSRKIESDDILLFYPKVKTIEQGIPAEIDVKSSIRIEGRVPELPKGDYLIALCPRNEKKSKFEEDLEFTIM